ncbi:MAG: DUF2927 domain-containing protein [Pseudomonadota bacterium]
MDFIRPLLRPLAACAVLSACSVPSDVPDRMTPQNVTLPAMQSFTRTTVDRPNRSNTDIARDFLDLSFRLESGRALPVLTRFEIPVTLRVLGDPPPTLDGDLDMLVDRIRREAQIDITRVNADVEASITIEVITRRELNRAVPLAACFVVPRVTSWAEFRRNRRSSLLDWTTLQTRERMAIFMPGDVSPQEVRDCLHEEIAQALGPLNDLYRLDDSVFNDDNFHTVLTGFDMLMLRATYDETLQSGMTRDQVAARLPAILDRLNPAGRGRAAVVLDNTPREWIDAIETALGPRTLPARRRTAAKRAVAIALDNGWTDVRLGFAQFALGRLSLGAEPDLALTSFLSAASLFESNKPGSIQGAHVAMQLSAFALSAGDTEVAIAIVNRNIPVVSKSQNAALLATLLLVKAEALELEGKSEDAAIVRGDALGWARYGFTDEAEVRKRLNEIRQISPAARPGGDT